MSRVTLCSSRHYVPGVRLPSLAPASVALMAALLILSACASGNSSAKTGNSGNTGNTGNNASSPTATSASNSAPHGKPTTVPHITQAFCQGLVSISDVNGVLKPATQPDTIVPIDASPGGSCTYLDSNTAITAFTLNFQAFQAGSSLSDAAQLPLSVAEVQALIPYGTSVNTTPISGIGDQALFASYSGAIQGGNGYLNDLVTATGAVLLSCYTFGSGSPTTAQQPALTQLCTQAVGRL